MVDELNPAASEALERALEAQKKHEYHQARLEAEAAVKHLEVLELVYGDQ